MEDLKELNERIDVDSIENPFEPIDSFEPTNVNIENGGFEGDLFEQPGTFDNWQTIGDTSIETEEIGIAPTEGEFQALIATGSSPSGGSVKESDLSEFLNLSPGVLDTLLGGDATEGSGIKQTFTAQAGDILEFDYTFLTDEATFSDSNSSDSDFNDSAFFSLDGFTLELNDTFDPTFSETPVEGYSEATETKTFRIAISEAGTYDLGFGIVDLTDDIFDSGMLIDNVNLISTGIDIFTSEITDNVFQGGDDISSDVDAIFGNSKGFTEMSAL